MSKLPGHESLTTNRATLQFTRPGNRALLVTRAVSVVGGGAEDLGEANVHSLSQLAGGSKEA